MLWAIVCVDKPDVDAVRARFKTAHSTYLKTHKEIILLSGARLIDDGSRPVGSHFVIKGANRAEAEAFIENEPFASSGVFASVTITRVRKGELNPEVAEGE